MPSGIPPALACGWLVCRFKLQRWGSNSILKRRQNLRQFLDLRTILGSQTTIWASRAPNMIIVEAFAIHSGLLECLGAALGCSLAHLCGAFWSPGAPLGQLLGASSLLGAILVPLLAPFWEPFWLQKHPLNNINLKTISDIILEPMLEPISKQILTFLGVILDGS